MALLTWSHASSIGNKTMDVQHGILVDTMNELRQALLTDCTEEQIEGLTDRLVEFARIHFASEEALLERHGFPGLTQHRAEHARLIEDMQIAMQRAHQSAWHEMRPLLSFLRAALLEHIEQADHVYGEWLNVRGIS
ncbi:MAG TPA: bacteriohemerythrin [Terracidiphilus sp.]|nr:bacteriohemerythrin [Terracidiphilus sp.]